MNTRKILINISIGVAIVAAITVGLVFWLWLFNQFNRPSTTPVADVYGALSHGKWGWEQEESGASCTTNPHAIVFRHGNTEAIFRFDKKFKSTSTGTETNEFLYKVISKDGNRLTMQIVGEKRLDKRGQPVVWDLVMLNENEYAWHRLDWPQGALTKRIHLCSK